MLLEGRAFVQPLCALPGQLKARQFAVASAVTLPVAYFSICCYKTSFCSGPIRTQPRKSKLWHSG